MQHFLMIYHGISHLSLVFSWSTHLPKGLCVVQENTSDSWDIIKCATRKRCITSMDWFICVPVYSGLLDDW